MTAFAGLFLFLRHSLVGAWLLDLHVYARAGRMFRTGESPYYQGLFEGLRFLYPPVVLYALRALAILPGDSPWLLLALVHLTSVLLTPFVLARYYLRERWLTPVMAVLVWLGESRFTGMLALYSANVAPTLYLACLLAAVPGLRRNRWAWFYAAVVLSASVKITLLTLLLLPLFAGRRQWLRSFGCVLGVGVIYALQARLFPALYAGYKWAVLQQVQVEHQYGYGIYGIAASLDEKLHRPVGIEAYAVHALFVALLLGALLWLRHRRADLRAPDIWMGLLLMTVIVANPRVLHYDVYLALFAAYVVLAVVLGLSGWKLILLLVGLYAPSLAVPYVLHTKLMYGSYELCIILVALAAGIGRLWRTSEEQG
jgi:hypothetical protein